MSKKMGFVVNIQRCIGCHACEMSCKNYYQLHPKVRRRAVYELDEQITESASRVYLSAACNHCDEPACKEACPVGAYSKRADGIVLHDENRCIGCQMCVIACPYHVPQYNPEKKKVDKCHMCYDLQDNNELPVCVANCPMEAIELVDLSTEQKGTVKEIEGFADPTITKPNIRFIKPRTGVHVRREL